VKQILGKQVTCA